MATLISEGEVILSQWIISPESTIDAGRDTSLIPVRLGFREEFRDYLYHYDFLLFGNERSKCVISFILIFLPERSLDFTEKLHFLHPLSIFCFGIILGKGACIDSFANNILFSTNRFHYKLFRLHDHVPWNRIQWKPAIPLFVITAGWIYRG